MKLVDLFFWFTFHQIFSDICITQIVFLSRQYVFLLYKISYFTSIVHDLL